MTFRKFIDNLPRPRAYLLAGIPRPENTRNVDWSDTVGSLDELTRFLNSGDADRSEPRSFTAVDETGEPIALAYLPSNRYLGKPTSRVGSAMQGIRRLASGELSIERTPEYAHAGHPTLARAEPGTTKVATVDQSVMFAGFLESKFEPGTALFASMALEIEMAAIRTTDVGYPHPGHGTRFGNWGSAVTVPIDNVVLRIYVHITTLESRPYGDDALDRTDLLCAATALAYESPMYTTEPDKYAWIKNGLKLIEYGPDRSKGARRTTKPKGQNVETAEGTPSEQLVAAYRRGEPFNGGLLDKAIAEPTGLVEALAFVLEDEDNSDDAWRVALLREATRLAPVLSRSDPYFPNVISATSYLIHGQPDHSEESELAIRALGAWGRWPQDASSDILFDLENEPGDERVHTWYRAYLLMIGLDAAQADAEIAAVVAGTVPASRARLDELAAARNN